MQVCDQGLDHLWATLGVFQMWRFARTALSIRECSFVISGLGFESILCFVLNLSHCLGSVFLLKGLSCCSESVPFI